MTELQIQLEAFRRAPAAGVAAGALYGLDVRGAGHDFRDPAGNQLRPGRPDDAGHVRRSHFFIALGSHVLAGSPPRAYLSILLTVPGHVCRGLPGAPAADLARHRRAHRGAGRGGHYAQLILTLGIALIPQNGGMMVFGPQLVSIRTTASSSAWEIDQLRGDFAASSSTRAAASPR